MKPNTGKCCSIISGTKYEYVWIKLGKNKIWESNSVKLLGAKIDKELKFGEHFSNICLKANKTLRKKCPNTEFYPVHIFLCSD